MGVIPGDADELMPRMLECMLLCSVVVVVVAVAILFDGPTKVVTGLVIAGLSNFCNI